MDTAERSLAGWDLLLAFDAAAVELEARRLAFELQRWHSLEDALLEANPGVVAGGEGGASAALDRGARRIDLGIPFDFTGKPVVATPQPPRETVRVQAVRPERDALEIRFPRVEGYRVELPEDRLSANFTADSVMDLTPELVGATETQNSGIIGQQINLNLVHTSDVRPSQVLYELTAHLVMNHWRDPGGEPQLNLFGQFKRIAKQWLDGYLVCKGGTYPAQLKYKTLADMACQRIVAGISRHFEGERPIKAVLDPYNPIGSTAHVNFTTSQTDRWETDARRSQVNWVILDSDWEAEFCRVAEAHPKVRAYVKNRSLGFEVPYLSGSEVRKYLPDFIVLIDDGRGEDDLLHLIVEIKGYRREDAKEKKLTMDTYWVPGVNHLKSHGRWAFAEFTDVYRIEADFKAKVQSEFARMLNALGTDAQSVDAFGRERAERYLASQLGGAEKWTRINAAIWTAIETGPTHAFELSKVDEVAASISCDAGDILAVVALLSSQSLPFLKMELLAQGQAPVPSADFQGKLVDWWRKKTVSDAEWRDWASEILVRWTAGDVSRMHS